eukprot:4453803-Amphidinium_carterae.3
MEQTSAENPVKKSSCKRNVKWEGQKTPIYAKHPVCLQWRVLVASFGYHLCMWIFASSMVIPGLLLLER